MTQPAVSRSIAELERAVGVRLLDRNAQGVSPTAYGRALLDGGTAVFDDLYQAVKNIEFLADPAIGEVRIGSGAVHAATFVSAVIERLSQHYPRIVFHVVTVTEPNTLHHELSERKVDLLITRRLGLYFEPVALLATNPQLIVSKNAVPAKSLLELIAWLKASPDKASAGTAGVGTPGHVTGLLFQKITGTRFQFVPYRGGAPAVQDLVAGNIDLMFGQTSDSLAQVRAGTIRAYAVTAKDRVASAPDIPTVDVAGLPEFYISNWIGLWVPSRTPKDVIIKLHSAVVDALAEPTVQHALAELGLDTPSPDQTTSAALGALQKAEIERWWPIVRGANIKGE